MSSPVNHIFGLIAFIEIIFELYNFIVKKKELLNLSIESKLIVQ